MFLGAFKIIINPVSGTDYCVRKIVVFGGRNVSGASFEKRIPGFRLLLCLITFRLVDKIL